MSYLKSPLFLIQYISTPSAASKHPGPLSTLSECAGPKRRRQAAWSKGQRRTSRKASSYRPHPPGRRTDPTPPAAAVGIYRRRGHLPALPLALPLALSIPAAVPLATAVPAAVPLVATSALPVAIIITASSAVVVSAVVVSAVVSAATIASASRGGNSLLGDPRELAARLRRRRAAAPADAAETIAATATAAAAATAVAAAATAVAAAASVAATAASIAATAASVAATAATASVAATTASTATAAAAASAEANVASGVLDRNALAAGACRAEPTAKPPWLPVAHRTPALHIDEDTPSVNLLAVTWGWGGGLSPGLPGPWDGGGSLWFSFFS